MAGLQSLINSGGVIGDKEIEKVAVLSAIKQPNIL
jgi:hypothetical protein